MKNPFSGVKFRLAAGTAPISVEDYQQRAKRKVPDMVWAYIDGGADDLRSLERNRSSFDHWEFRPRVLTGQDGTDLASEFGGQALELPVFLAPTGMSGLAHWTGEAAAAKAAERAGTRAVLSTAASYTPEEVGEATEQNHFFQLYPWAGRAGMRDLSARFIERARNAGFQGLVVTVDVPTHGNREGERRRGLGAPPMLTPGRIANAALRPAWCYDFMFHQRIASKLLLEEVAKGGNAVDAANAQLRLMQPIDWDDFRWMRQSWRGPLILKGVLHPDDAEQAVALGADGIIVSNHGGRQLDGVQATIDALPAITERVAGRVPVYLDGGIRRGSDVVKALCLGATSVGIGRPYLYGLASDGQAGVENVLNIFKQEISRCLALLGVHSVKDLSRELLVSSTGELLGTERKLEVR